MEDDTSSNSGSPMGEFIKGFFGVPTSKRKDALKRAASKPEQSALDYDNDPLAMKNPNYKGK